VIPNTLDHMTQGELQRYENNYKTINLITTVLGRNVYDRVAHLEMAHDVWLKLCNTYEGSYVIKSSRRDIYNRQSSCMGTFSCVACFGVTGSRWYHFS
jgi:hypothetical protein